MLTLFLILIKLFRIGKMFPIEILTFYSQKNARILVGKIFPTAKTMFSCINHIIVTNRVWGNHVPFSIILMLHFYLRNIIKNHVHILVSYKLNEINVSTQLHVTC